MTSEFEGIRQMLQRTIQMSASGDPTDLREFPDLHRLLRSALEAVDGDWRRIWYRPSATFESNVVNEDAVIMGGLHSPAFLRRDPALRSSPIVEWPVVPLTWQASAARVLVAESIEGDIGDWIPFLEKLVTKKHALVCVTPTIAPAMLNLFMINELRGTMHNAVVHSSNASEFAPHVQPGEAPDPKLVKSLPVVSVLARRAASVFTAESELPWSRQSCIWVNVGGSDYDDQLRQLTSFAWAVANQVE